MVRDSQTCGFYIPFVHICCYYTFVFGINFVIFILANLKLHFAKIRLSFNFVRYFCEMVVHLNCLVGNEKNHYIFN